MEPGHSIPAGVQPQQQDDNCGREDNDSGEICSPLLLVRFRFVQFFSKKPHENCPKDPRED